MAVIDTRAGVSFPPGSAVVSVGSVLIAARAADSHERSEIRARGGITDVEFRRAKEKIRR